MKQVMPFMPRLFLTVAKQAALPSIKFTEESEKHIVNPYVTCTEAQIEYSSAQARI